MVVAGEGADGAVAAAMESALACAHKLLSSHADRHQAAQWGGGDKDCFIFR